jgi:hypothetical protein
MSNQLRRHEISLNFYSIQDIISGLWRSSVDVSQVYKSNAKYPDFDAEFPWIRKSELLNWLVTSFPV